jgi:hypothetical protein
MGDISEYRMVQEVRGQDGLIPEERKFSESIKEKLIGKTNIYPIRPYFSQWIL